MKKSDLYFRRLVKEVSLLCEDKGFSDNTSRYLVNKVSNLIRRSKLDVYQVYLSFDSFNYDHIYTKHEVIYFSKGKLYVTMVID